jgi:hypothetical protein
VAILSPSGQDYADPLYKCEHDNAEWIHTVDSIVSSLIEAGLEIEFFYEHSSCPCRCFRSANPQGQTPGISGVI